MFTSMLRKSVLSAVATGPNVYGSTRAAQMLLDAANGVDSLDVITIGDSNAMYSGANGYNMGWHRALQFGLRIKPYGTPLFAGGMFNPATGQTNVSQGTLLNQVGLGVNAGTSAQGSNAGTNSSATTSNMIAANTDTEIVGLRNYLGMSVSVLENSVSNSLLFPNGFGANPVVVEKDARFTSSENNNVHISNQYVQFYTNFGAETVFGTDGNGAGTTLTYRLVYGTFPSAGNFRPVWWWLPGGQVGKRESASTTTGGGYGYATQSYTYAPTYNAVDQKSLRVTWDGYNSATAAHQTTGPFAALWQSVINTAIRGYSVSNLVYYGGLTTTQIANKITGADKLLDAFLKEIRERQVACGGSGNTIVFLNAGVNVSGQWSTDAQTIVTRMKERWISSGGTASNLAFVFTVTHPKTIGSWSTGRAAVSTEANAWGQSAGDNVCVVDIGAMIDGPTLLKYQLYGDGTTDAGQSHLATIAIPPAASGTMADDGYQIVTSRIVSALLAL